MKEKKIQNLNEQIDSDLILIKDYWVCFREAHSFLKYFMKYGFSHVYILYNDGVNWLQLDPRNRAFEVFVLPYKSEENIPEQIRKTLKHKVVKVKVELSHKALPNLNIFNFIHCANIVKYILGQKMCAFTPYQLYKRLGKMVRKKKYKPGILEIKFL